MNGARIAIVLLLAGGWPLAARAAHAQGALAHAAADSFPHARHQHLFTACDACHAGIDSSDVPARYPTPDFCLGCHDGSVARRVTWAPPPPRATNVRFTHPAHPPIPCESCHAASDTAAPMDVGRARPDRCVSCHAPEAESHLAQTSCGPCHGSIGAARDLAVADIARFPQPPSHDSSWVFRHRDQATSPTCATCHARQWCASCHVNAPRVAAIQALEPDDRVAALARSRHVVYPQPASHRTAGFLRTHGLTARAGAAACANCHTRESCLTCHRQEERLAGIAALPRQVRGGARGVDLEGMRPPDHAPDFQLSHRTAAAAGEAVCGRCHAPSYCATCHAGAAAPVFHGSNFVERHSETAYTGGNDCSACHQRETFCVSCHRTTGQARTGAPLGQFHNNQPYWIFGHGGVARRAVETCASCHQQRDCLQCHSASRGWKVNPHGRGFDAGAAGRNQAMCRLCHENGPPQ
ncbi:MAG: hypothetical protein A2085_00995 [Gemmatimonadetes bacterium GWC2_71_10]|nr:MAG: hypothetical protein A2085_00995 [Gemmatimonadetes bacterium GWC2_71_10]